MEVIKKIDLSSIEEFMKEIVASSSQIKLLQEELEDVILHANENEKLFSAGKISKEVYKKNKARLVKEKNQLRKKINVELSKLIKIINETKKLMEANRI